MTDTENKALYIANECRKAGMTLSGAAGVLANIEAESAFISTNVQDAYEGKVGNDLSYTAKVDNGSYQGFAGDDAGYGLCQWTASERKAQMLSYFRQRGKSIGDFKTQVEWMLYEMQRRNSDVFNLCCSSNNAYKCGYQICKYYETPANTDATSEYRGGQADKWYAWLSFNDSDPEIIPDEPEPEKPEEPKTWPPRMIDEHCEGFPEIKLLQSLLVCHGYTVVVDGIFGKALAEKVRAFQKDHRLDPDGIVGPLTWGALLKI